MEFWMPFCAVRLRSRHSGHLYPGSDALSILTVICTRQGEFVEARKYLQHGIKLSPSYRDLRLAMGQLARAEREKRAVGLLKAAP